MAIVIPSCTTAKLTEIFGRNFDKNYLTSLELAALVDNNIIDVTEETVTTFVADLGLPVSGELEVVTIREAVLLANFNRRGMTVHALTAMRMEADRAQR